MSEELKAEISELKSEIFKMPRGKMIGFLFFKYGKWWLIPLVVSSLILIAVGIAFGDLRYMILALMVILIMIPMVMAIVIINHSLHPDIAFNILPHTVEISDNGILIRILSKEESEESKEEESEKAKDQLADNDSDKDKSEKKDINEKKDIDIKEGVGAYREIIREIPFSNIGKYDVGLDSVLIYFNKTGFIYLPSNAFAGQKEYLEFINRITSARSASINI